jgi:RNA polymerase sigma-70 factor (ECF subfamily)
MALTTDVALARLYRQRPQLLAYIRAIIGDSHLAEDVLQELALLMVRKVAELPEEAIDGWLRRAARFIALNAARRAHNRRLEPLDVATLDRLEAHWDAWDEDRRIGLRTALRDCLERLPRQARTLIERRYAEGWSADAEAPDAGGTLNALYQRLGRIHRTLAACVRQRLGGGAAGG